MGLITILALAFVTPSASAQTFGVSLDMSGDISAASGLQRNHPGGTLVVTIRFDEAVILTANEISIAGYGSNGNLIADVGLVWFAPTTAATEGGILTPKGYYGTILL